MAEASRGGGKRPSAFGGEACNAASGEGTHTSQTAR